MSEVSGTCGMCMAFSVHPMCSNYETLLADYTWKTSQVTSSMQVKYKSATWVNAWGASQVQVLDFQVEYSNTLWLGPSSAQRYICIEKRKLKSSSEVVYDFEEGSVNIPSNLIAVGQKIVLIFVFFSCGLNGENYSCFSLSHLHINLNTWRSLRNSCGMFWLCTHIWFYHLLVWYVVLHVWLLLTLIQNRQENFLQNWQQWACKIRLWQTRTDSTAYPSFVQWDK